MRRLSPRAVGRVKVVLFLLSLLPLGRLIVGAFSNGLGTNPLELITRSTGTWTLVFLTIALGVTPLRKWSGWVWLAQCRRMFGLFAFFYAACHFTTFIWFDHFFDWAAIWKDVLKRPFVTVGFAALLMMLPLALTSTNGMVRRLGSRRWQWLHRLVYPVGVLGVVHYWWLVKRDLTQPVIYALVMVVLLGARLWWAIRSPGMNARAAGSHAGSEG